MAHSTASLYHANDTAAHYKAWAQFISNFFATAGWAQTADTGQVVWASVSTVPSANTLRDFEIWKSTDALSTGSPIYIKIWYGNGGGTQPQIWWQVGTGGTDGAGNMLAPCVGVIKINSYDNQLSANTACYIAGDAGSFRFIMFDNGGNAYPDNYAPMIFSVGRSVDNAGVLIGDYVLAMSCCGANAQNYWNGVINNAARGGVYPFEFISLVNACPYTYGSSGGNVLVSPVFPFIGALGNPTLDVFLGRSSDFTDASTVQFLVYGTLHTYIVWNQNVNISGNNSVKGALLLRWE